MKTETLLAEIEEEIDPGTIEMEFDDEPPARVRGATANGEDGDEDGELANTLSGLDDAGTDDGKKGGDEATPQRDADSDDDDTASYSEKVRARIRKETAKRREQERRAEAAERRAEEAERRYNGLAATHERTTAFAATNFEEKLKARGAELQRQYKEAYEAGDPDKMYAIQEQLADHRLEARQFETWKASQPARPQPGQDGRPAAPREDRPPQQPQQPKPSAKAQAWIAKNTWFTEDPVMHGAALGVHHALVQEGFEPDSDDYYAELDHRIHEAFPHKFQARNSRQQGGQQPRRPAATVAPPSRGARPGTGGPANKTRVTLTADQRRMAEELGVPLATYAAEVVRLGQS
jgi:hypothetical protein